jgi:hypothetical protein
VGVLLVIAVARPAEADAEFGRTLIWQQEGDPPTYRWKDCASCSASGFVPAPTEDRAVEGGECAIEWNAGDGSVEFVFYWIEPPTPPADGCVCCSYLECSDPQGSECAVQPTAEPGAIGWGNEASECEASCQAAVPVPAVGHYGLWILLALMLALGVAGAHYMRLRSAA